ncbi:MAG: hypothetical protein BWZ08_01836 [candidate division BRC1 bacterium ADurb.BinA292]|nr:MAG: hypothetical protein BWZ08_01836 [candidate division BRC1 bacterium ADurb.BinA292]
MAGDEAQAPADHVPALAHRVGFKADLERAVDGEEAQRLAAIGERQVGGVVDDDQTVYVSECNDSLEEILVGQGAGGAVGIIEDHEFGAAADLVRDGVQIDQVVVGRLERGVIYLATEIAGPGAGDGVAGDGHDAEVAGVDEHAGEEGEGGFGADAVIDLGRGVELDAVFAGHVARRRVLVFLNAVVGVAAVGGVVDFALEAIAHGAVGHLVVLADAEIEEPGFGVRRQRRPFRPLDLLELIDGVALAILGAADARGEEILKPGIGCGLGGGGRLRGARGRHERVTPAWNMSPAERMAGLALA